MVATEDGQGIGIGIDGQFASSPLPHFSRGESHPGRQAADTTEQIDSSNLAQIRGAQAISRRRV